MKNFGIPSSTVAAAASVLHPPVSSPSVTQTPVLFPSRPEASPEKVSHSVEDAKVPSKSAVAIDERNLENIQAREKELDAREEKLNERERDLDAIAARLKKEEVLADVHKKEMEAERE